MNKRGIGILAIILIVVAVAVVGVVALKPNVGFSPRTGITACTDSDGGINYNVQGTACAGKDCRTDFCVNNASVLTEYYCNQNSTKPPILSVNYNCSYGCLNGACNSPPPVYYLLTVTKQGTGQGTVTSNPAGINCGSDCSESYVQNTAVTLTAAAASGSVFAGWSGTAGCSGTGTCVVGMNTNRNAIATFNLQNQTNTSNMADLIITSLTQTGGGCSGGSNQTNVTCSVTFAANVSNIGNANAVATTTRFLLIAPSPVGGQASILTQALAPGQSAVIEATLGSLIYGNYSLTATADYFGNVTESNEGNNIATISFILP